MVCTWAQQSVVSGREVAGRRESSVEEVLIAKNLRLVNDQQAALMIGPGLRPTSEPRGHVDGYGQNTITLFA